MDLSLLFCELCRVCGECGVVCVCRGEGCGVCVGLCGECGVCVCVCVCVRGRGVVCVWGCVVWCVCYVRVCVCA